MSATCPATGNGTAPAFWMSSPVPTVKVSVAVPGRHALTAGLTPNARGLASPAAPAVACHPLNPARPACGPLPGRRPASANGAAKPPEERAETARARTCSVAGAAAIRASVSLVAGVGPDGGTGNPGIW